ncbi:MAG: ATP-binding protein [Actinomycetales bacterium]|uniref:histidine kinase n=1 Tax=Candidatus Phosphoribacter hodrii TaxID=2953743 RepID=A0A935M3U2_9MICO|nr:ATP-binding protein [Candidatus Phosphoribacter hodrii]
MTVGLVGLTVALVAAGSLLYAVLSATLANTLGAEANSAAREVATLVEQGRLSDPVPVSGALVVQVLDSSQRVIAGSLVADRLTPLLTADEVRRALAGEQLTVPGSRSGLSGRLHVAAVSAGPGSAPVTVIAGVPTGEVDVSLGLVRTLLFVGLPLLLLALAAVAWRVIGAALAPVEALRLGAERIGADARPRRRRATVDRLPIPVADDEIHSLATTLNGMLDRLDGLAERQQAFLDDAAHELRSPLASLRTQLEVAEHVGDGGSLPADLLPDVERLSRLVDDLLVLARSGNGEASPSLETVDLRPLLREIVSRYAAARVPVTLTDVAPGATAIEVPGNRADLRRVVTNLVDNAVRHASTAVTLSVGADPSGTWLRVTDDGHGIPPADRERVFERFTRLDEARDRDSGGTGLGLPIARELMRRNGADVTLTEAAPGVIAVVAWPRSTETPSS